MIPLFIAFRRYSLSPAITLIAFTAFAAAQSATLAAPIASATAPPPRAAQPYRDMNYGSFLSLSVETARGDIVNKGIGIRLDAGAGGVAEGNGFVIFDTDLLRYAAGWTGRGFIDWKGIAFDGQHVVHPSIVGQPVFTSPLAPGWARPGDGSFDDPRLRGLDQNPYGPLPRAWAQYKGLYRHGENVLLSYTVGDAAVLELPGLETSSATKVFTRTMAIGKSSHDLILEVCQGNQAAVEILARDSLSTANAPTGAPGLLAVLMPGKPSTNQPIAVACAGGNDRLEWVRDAKSNIRLRIPAAATPVRFKLLLAQIPAGGLKEFAALARTTQPPADLVPLTQGGPAQWPQKLKTQIRRGPEDGPFAIDTITLPADNPWRSWMRPGGFDFFDDGRRAAVCTWQGDVWIVDGLDNPAGELTWQRIAAGLFQPLGLKIVAGKIFVTCRDQIAVLHDLNGDGETDFYESFNNDAQVTEHFHEFAMDLQTDAAGNFYYAKGARHALNALVPHHGTLIMVSADGQKSEIVASGFRAPNGVCVNGDGTFIVSDQEGHWTPMNRINWIKPGGFYGNMGSYSPGRNPEDYEPPVCWIHKNTDRSPAEQLWVTSEQWSPLRGALLSLSYGTGRIWNVLFEKLGDRVQGGIVRLPLPEFPTGSMRGRFHPRDGQLYVCGLFGWSSNKTAPGGFYRVRATGKALHLPIRLSATQRGILITFTNPLDPAAAADPQNYSVAQWNYRRTAEYGSADYKVSDGTKGRDSVAVSGVKLSKDRRSVFLQIPDMRTCMQMQIQYDVTAADGTRISQVIENTIHFLREPGSLPGDQFEGGL